MKFKDCVKEFPIGKTYIGNYGEEGSLSITLEDVDFLKNSADFAVLEWQNTSEYDVALPFLAYEGHGVFMRWYFAGFAVGGYLNDTADEDGFYPATYSEDFGWDKYDPENPDNYNTSYFTPDLELREELIKIGRLDRKLLGNKWMNEQIAYHFDTEKYLRGEIITSYEQLKKFLKERKDS